MIYQRFVKVPAGRRLARPGSALTIGLATLITLVSLFGPCGQAHGAVLSLGGDVNGDGIRDVNDVQGVITAVLQGNAGSLFDVDGSGAGDVADVQLTISHVLGVGPDLPPTPEAPDVVIGYNNVFQAVVTVRWRDTATDEFAFEIQQRSIGGVFVTALSLPAGATIGVLPYTRPVADQEYRIVVRAPGGVVAGPVTRDLRPAVPTNLSAEVRAPDVVAVSWIDRSFTETGFRVERRVGNGAFEIHAVIRSGSYLLDQLAIPGERHQYRVTPLARGFTGETSSVVEIITTDYAEAPPRGLRATTTAAGTLVEWLDTSYETSYKFSYTRYENGHPVGFSSSRTLAADSTSYFLVLDGQSTWHFKVEASGPNGSGAATLLYQVPIMPPRIGNLSPKIGPMTGGDLVSIVGFNFTRDTVVRFAGVPATELTLGPGNRITCRTPAVPRGPVDVQVENSAGSETFAWYRGVLPNPTLSSISPAALPTSGGRLYLDGMDFDFGCDVLIGGYRFHDPNLFSETRIFVDVPSRSFSPGTYDVTVEAPFHGRTSTLTAALEIGDPPHVSSIAPRSGPASGGTTVVINGSGFSPQARVEVGGVSLRLLQVQGSVRITGVTGAGTPGDQDVQVFNGGVPTSIQDAFRYRDWEDLELPDGSLLEIRYDTASPDLVYGISSWRLLRSLDAGVTWTPVDLARSSFNHLAVSGSTAYTVDHEHFVHADNEGAGQGPRVASGFSSVRDLRASFGGPGTGGALFLESYSSPAYGQTFALRSVSPRGYTSSIVSLHPLSNFHQCRAVPSRFFGVSQTGGVVRSTNFGAGWFSLLSPRPLPSRVFEVRSDPGNGDRALVKTGFPTDLFLTVDGGQSWTALSGPFDWSALIDFAIAPTASRFLFVRSAAGGWRSDDNGQTWSSITLPVHRNPTFHPTRPGEWLLGARGALRTLDFGQTWTRHTTGVAGGEPLSVDLDAAGRILVRTRNALLASDDQGASWQTLIEIPSSAGAVVAPDLAPGTLLVSDDYGLFRSTDAGQSFGHVAGFADVYALREIPGTTRVLAAELSRTQRSEDAGATWQIVGGLPERISTFAVGLSGGVMAVGNGVAFSADGGLTWTARSAPTPSRIAYAAPDPTASGTFFVGAAGETIYRTQDNGLTWTGLGETADLAAVSPSGVLYSSRSSDGTLQRSQDGGVTWVRADSTMPSGARARVLLFPDPSAPQTILLGTRFGLFRTTTGGS